MKEILRLVLLLPI